MVQHRIPVQRAVSRILVVLLALLAVHYAGAPLPWPHVADWLYQLVEAGAAAACLLRAARGPERGAWLCLGLGMAFFCAGDVYYTVAFGDGDAAFPSPADAGYLAFYPASYVALVLFTRARLASFARSLWLDGLIGALAVGAVGAALLVEPIMARTGG